MTSPRDDDRPAPTLEPKLQAHIGRQLRQLYDQMISEPVPDRFKALLDRLESAETKQDAASPVMRIDGRIDGGLTSRSAGPITDGGAAVDGATEPQEAPR